MVAGSRRTGPFLRPLRPIPTVISLPWERGRPERRALCHLPRRLASSGSDPTFRRPLILHVFLLAVTLCA